MCDDLKGKNHKVYSENYFTSYDLMKYLASVQDDACGTVNIRRKHFLTLKEDKSFMRGEFDYRVTVTLHGMIGRIKKDVCMYFKPSMTQKTLLQQVEKIRTVVKQKLLPKLRFRLQYRHMNYVDKFDQLKKA